MTTLDASLPTDLGDIPMGRIQQDPLRFLREVTDAYPDIVRYRTGGWQVVLLNRPDYLRHVLKSNVQNYTKFGTPDLMLLRPMLGAGLMTVDGDEWFHQRRYLQPTFNNEVIDDYLPEMVCLTGELLDTWAADVARGQSIEMAQRFSHLTLSIIAKTLFSRDLTQRAEAFGQAVDVLSASMAHFDPWDQQAILSFQQAQTVIGMIVQEVIESPTNPTVRSDLLATLRHASDREQRCPLSQGQIRDQIFTILMAGHETTAKSLTWAVYLLARHPKIQARCRAEALQVWEHYVSDRDRVDHLEYTWQVLQEAMRIYPPVWTMSRKAIDDDVIGGFHVDAGTLVIMSPYALHRRQDIWRDSERFDPDRFVSALVAERDPFAYLPFSGGPRVCIGRPFAIIETKLILAMLLRRFEVELLVDEEIEPEALVTLRPRQGLAVRLTPVTP